MIKNNILLIWWFIWYLKVGVNEFCRGAKYRSIVQHKQNSYPDFPPPSGLRCAGRSWNLVNGTIIRKNICFTSAVRLIPLQHSCSSFFTKVLFVPFTTLSGDLKIFASEMAGVPRLVDLCISVVADELLQGTCKFYFSRDDKHRVCISISSRRFCLLFCKIM